MSKLLSDWCRFQSKFATGTDKKGVHVRVKQFVPGESLRVRHLEIVRIIDYSKCSSIMVTQEVHVRCRNVSFGIITWDEDDEGKATGAYHKAVQSRDM